MEPIAATVAGFEPDSAAKNAEAITVIIPSPPGIVPTKDLANSTSRRDIPPVSIKPPAIIKKGMAMNGNESTAVNIRWATTNGGVGISPNSSAAIPERPRATPIGTLTSNNMTKTPNNMASIPTVSPLLLHCAGCRLTDPRHHLATAPGHQHRTDRNGAIGEPHGDSQGRADLLGGNLRLDDLKRIVGD